MSTPTPCPDAVAAWGRLLRVQQTLLAAVEKDLKDAGFPALVWYDALSALRGAPHAALRPRELERKVMLPQYATSRLVDRMVRSGYVERKTCPVDGRGQFVAITASGRNLQKKMWQVYGAAIQRHVAAKLSGDDAVRLSELLGRLV